MIATRRMFASSVVESDQFLDMPATSQLLYFHLGMRADNDGVVDSAKQIMRIIGAADGDMRVLVDAGYVIVMPDARIIVITDWHTNNSGIRFDGAHNKHGRYYDLIKSLETNGKHYLPETYRRPTGELPETYHREQQHKENNIEQQQEIEQIIVKFKVKPTVKALLREGRSIDEVKAGLLLLLNAVNNVKDTANSVKNPGAWLRRAVERGWTDSEAERRKEARLENEKITASALKAMEEERKQAEAEEITTPEFIDAMNRHRLTKKEDA